LFDVGDQVAITAVAKLEMDDQWGRATQDGTISEVVVFSDDRPTWASREIPDGFVCCSWISGTVTDVLGGYTVTIQPRCKCRR